MKTVGMQLGDKSLVWFHEDTPVRVPARVGALTLSGQSNEVAYLLAGDEVQGTPFDIRLPRQSGYFWTNQTTSRILLQAFLARVRQDLPPGGAPSLHVAVPFWYQNGETLVQAASETGWGQVRLVTDLYALALLAAEKSDPVPYLCTLIPGDEMLDAALWRRDGDNWLPLAWENWANEEIRESLARLLTKAGSPVTVAVGGDAAPEWLSDGLKVTLDGLGANWLDLGWDGVARAVSAVLPPPLPVTERLQMRLQLQDQDLQLPEGLAGATAWRALQSPAAAMAIRIVGRWGLETEPALVLWETVLRTQGKPVLLGLHWAKDGLSAEVTLRGTQGEELRSGRLMIRPH